MEKVSIILPVFNVEIYLRDCLDSLLAQSYRNIEIILIDDGSKDLSGEIADEYAKKESRVIVFHKENGGVASARNLGLKNASGDFIIFVDPDDWITEDHVAYLLKLQHKNDSDVCMTTSLFTQRGEKQTEVIEEKLISPEKAAIMLLSPDMYVGSYSKIYRREWLLNNNLWQDETIFSGEGLHFTVKAVQYARSVTISNKKIYYYRRNVSTSATTKFNINMFSNNEHSLNLIQKEKLFESKEFDIMWHLFRAHLFVSGILAIESNSSKEKYKEEYTYWMETVKNDLRMLLSSNIVPTKSKTRILLAVIFPNIWAKLANLKRKRIFKKSV